MQPPKLICPACGESLSSSLTCQNNHTFPVVEGIPRFVAADQYAGSFGFQWNTFDVVRETDDAEIFKVKTSWDPAALQGKAVLDGGCGGGRYAYLLGKAGAQLYGIDLSRAVQKAKTTCQDLPNVKIFQADVFKLPFAPAQFDYVYSIGVLHHTPNTKKALQSLAQMVKPGGQLAVWLYRKNTWPQEVINSSLRAVTSRLPHVVLKPITFFLGAVLGGIPVINATLARIVSFGSSVPDWRLRACDAFDWYSPKYQFHHTPEELLSWFKEEGFTDLKFLRPQKSGKLYDWAYDHDLINGSGVNVVGTKF